MQNNFSSVLALVKLMYKSCHSSSLHSFIQRCKRDVFDCQHIKKSRLKLDQITNDLLPDLVIIIRRINFKSISSLDEHWCRHSCCSCPIADTKQSSGDSGCTLRTIVLFQLSPTNKHPMTSNSFELVVASSFQSSAMICVIGSFEQSLKL